MDKSRSLECTIKAKNCLIENVRFVDGSRHLDETETDILLSDGRIKKIAPHPLNSDLIIETEQEYVRIDAKGLWLWPGLVDGHVHLREPGYEHKETFASGCRAAACGGYTTVICEPNTNPPLASACVINEAARKSKNDGCVNVLFKAAMTHNREGRRVAEYQEFKGTSDVVALSDDGDPVSSALLSDMVCREAAKTPFVLSPHCEDSERVISDYESGAYPGFKRTLPYHNETLYVERDARCALKHGCKIHFSHLSFESSISLISDIRNSPSLKSHITCEVTPHHLLLSERDYTPGKTPRVNPPLRSKNDVAALQEALKDGRIDAIGSDHAPHSHSEKLQGAMGFIGLETSLALILTHFVRPGHITPLDACRLLSSAPAIIFNIHGGSAIEGQSADLVLIDPHRRWEVDSENFYSKSKNTPFEGHQLIGKAIGTIVKGKFVFADISLKNRIVN